MPTIKMLNNIDFFQETLDTVSNGGLEAIKKNTNLDALKNLIIFFYSYVHVHELSFEDKEKLANFSKNVLCIYGDTLKDSSILTELQKLIDVSKNLNEINAPLITNFDINCNATETTTIKQTNVTNRETVNDTLPKSTHVAPSLAVLLGSTSVHGAISGILNGVAQISAESAKTDKQRNVIKAVFIVCNSLVIASLPLLLASMENKNESDEQTETMWRSFAVSWASSVALSGLGHDINYCTKNIKNKFASGFFNALPLGANLGLLATRNNLVETATIVGTHVASASLFSIALQKGWSFFSKPSEPVSTRNNYLKLNTRNVSVENPVQPVQETSYVNYPPRLSNNFESIYSYINEEDANGYLQPKPPAPPERNQQPNAPTASRNSP